jgi:hypothetical protein
MYYATYRAVMEVHSTKRGDFAVPFPAYFGMRGLNMDAIPMRIVSFVFGPAHCIDKQLRPAEWAVSQWKWPPNASPVNPVAEESNSKPAQSAQNAEPELPTTGF